MQQCIQALLARGTENAYVGAREHKPQYVCTPYALLVRHWWNAQQRSRTVFRVHVDVAIVECVRERIAYRFHRQMTIYTTISH